MLPNLGINEVDGQKLLSQIDIVFHSAATVRYVLLHNRDLYFTI